MADRSHKAFWLDLIGKIGVPIFAGTLVACLLRGGVRPIHYVLLGAGLLFIYIGHRAEYHGRDAE